MKIKQKITLMLLGLVVCGSISAQRGWEKMSSGVVKDLNDVFFIDSLEGWTVGNSGTILHTADGGILWEIQPGATTSFFQGIWFSDDTTGWVVGSSGTMLRTDNKGENWSAANFPIAQGLTDIMFCNPLNGWIVGDLGIIFHTFDGGEKWQYQFAGVEQSLLSVSFTDVNNGWIAGSYNFGWLSHTQNGGIEWTDFPLPIDDLTYCVFFISPYRGWAGTGSMVMYTDDVGDTWSEQLLPEGSGNVTDLFFINDMQGWALTEKYIYYTGNAGMNWELQLQAENSAAFSAIYFTDAQHGWVVGSSGLVYRTTDGGGTGLQEIDISDRIVVFPNPAIERLNIRLEDPFCTGTDLTMEIYDQAGHLLFRDMSLKSNELQIPLNGMKGPVTIRVSQKGMSGSCVVIIP
ncbi:MAG TPA: YCF48-related protein [Bacteroidales bacterium]|nr:YCF48-related protein [Bacteroidales bacterium]